MESIPEATPETEEERDLALVEVARAELPYATGAFAELVRRHEPSVLRTCLHYLGSHPEAEEAAQDVFLRVFRTLPRFEGRARFRTWLYRIAMNVCATRYGKRRTEAWRREEILADRREDFLAAQASGCAVESPGADEGLDGPVGAALARLREEERSVLVLRHVAELSFEELAAALELKLSAAKMRLYRAEERFREVFRESRSASE